MIRSTTYKAALIVQLVLLPVTSLTLTLCFAQTKNDTVVMLPLSPFRVSEAAARIAYSHLKTVRWQDQEYPVAQGIGVLMHVINNKETDPNQRAKALDRLGQYVSLLRNTGRIPELINIYDSLQEREEKGGVLLCLVKSKDARGLPLLYESATKATDPIIRLFGAGGLSQWNIRQGATELINLFSSNVKMPRGTVGEEAWILFEDINKQKQWGCPVMKFRKAMLTMTNETSENRSSIVLMQKQLRKWFEANKERFPDWQPGDPLPESPPIESTQPR